MSVKPVPAEGGAGQRGERPATAGETRGADERFEQVLADYLIAKEAGRAPPRREFIANHPEFAADLDEFFADQEGLDRWPSPPLGLGEATEGPPRHPLTTSGAGDGA